MSTCPYCPSRAALAQLGFPPQKKRGKTQGQGVYAEARFALLDNADVVDRVGVVSRRVPMGVQDRPLVASLWHFRPQEMSTCIPACFAAVARIITGINEWSEINNLKLLVGKATGFGHSAADRAVLGTCERHCTMISRPVYYCLQSS